MLRSGECRRRCFLGSGLERGDGARLHSQAFRAQSNSHCVGPGSLHLTCILRRCRHPVFGNPTEHETVRVFTCKRLLCLHRFCAQCQQPVSAGGTGHSCDGSLEMADLMQRQGWRRCPGALFKEEAVGSVMTLIYLQARARRSSPKRLDVTTCRFVIPLCTCSDK
jgi:hypothetical protein